MLRRQLYQDLDAHPGPGCHAGREDRTGCWCRGSRTVGHPRAAAGRR
jgi:hypothetical protein